jgi:hypothetical protein
MLSQSRLSVNRLVWRELVPRQLAMASKLGAVGGAGWEQDIQSPLAITMDVMRLKVQRVELYRS